MTRRALLPCLVIVWMMVSGAAWGQVGPWHKTVYDHLAAGDCKRAAESLRSELAQPDGPVLLLAGWLSQWGHCIERSADNAWRFYERAHAAGEPSAALWLAGLAATSAGGADVAAVLWWGRKTRGDRWIEIRDCDPAPGQPEVSEAAFVEALTSWPQDKLLRCRNEVGYRALVVAELIYPIQAIRRASQGVVGLTYDLHEATVSVTPISQRVAPELLQHVEVVAKRAMLDMPRSPIPLVGRVELEFQLR